MTPNERKLKVADYLGFTVIPGIASTFVVTYWVLGMTKYYSPEVSMDAITEALIEMTNFVLGTVQQLRDMQTPNATTKGH